LPGTSAPSGTTSSNVVLNFFPGTFGSFAGLRIASEWMHPGHADTVHAVRLQVHDYDGTGRYTLQFDLNVDVFPPLLRARTMAHFRSILDSCLRDPDQAIEAVDLLTP